MNQVYFEFKGLTNLECNDNETIESEGTFKSIAHAIQGVSNNREENDFYPTPPNAIYELLKREEFKGEIWECACGDGAISKVLESEGHQVFSSDLIDRGYGIGNMNFLLTDRKTENIMTNPPYKHATEFVKHSLKTANKKVALLMKIQFLEGIDRHALFKNSPLKTVYVFSRRLKIYKNGLKTANSTMMCFAWFVWEHGYNGKPVIEFIL